EEEVIHTKRFFDDIPSEKLNRRGPPVRFRFRNVLSKPVVLIGEIDEDIEDERHADPHAPPGQRFLHGDDVSFPVEDTEIQHEQEQNEDNERRPQPHQKNSSARTTASSNRGASSPFR